jgi:hypothetical protein
MYSGMQTNGVPTIITGGGNDNGLFGGGGGMLGGLLFGALLGGRGLGGFGGGYGMDGGGAARAAIGSEIVITPTLNAMQNQINGISTQLSTNGLASEINGVESSINSLGLATMAGIKDNANLYLQGTGDILAGQAANNFQTLSSLNGAVSTITTQNYNAALQQLNSFNQLNTTQLQGFNELGRDNSNNFNQIIMALNAQSAAAAACCCELKGAIHADGEMTRALITSNTIASLQAKLNDAKTSNTVLVQTNALKENNALQTNTILSHLIRPLS